MGKKLPKWDSDSSWLVWFVVSFVFLWENLQKKMKNMSDWIYKEISRR